ncbi:ATP-binding cassette domain-containing protein, partial [Klebsiella pneumoniae]|uniref:ATP-binding cassette domain-containing protein n=1 Tax=Klebsiella pneumoniae TaxID=573 RepID=UPI0019539F23
MKECFGRNILDSQLPIVSMRGISKSFAHIVALRSIDLDIYPGEIHAIMGENGAGKSTLVRALVGIWTPSHGSVRLDGAELQHWDPDELGRHLGYLPQNVEL